MAKTYCPECDAIVSVQDPKLGYLFKCPECGVELEVTSITPFDVYFPYDEDWDQEENQEADWDDDGY
ncbi:MAG: lysine biosynthesis protein LysW [Anaerolineae bacterium]|nr:lysine biosynthesis protein LysW [Anaerolineae bacterium]